MRLVPSQFADDCGVSALACWASVSYDTAHEALWPGHKPRHDNHGTMPAVVARAIQRLGLGRWGYTNTKAWTAVPNGSIVCVVIVDNDCKGWHWVVKSRSGLMLDPLEPKRRSPPANYRVHGYLEKV
jgi:hypothetical protein